MGQSAASSKRSGIDVGSTGGLGLKGPVSLRLGTASGELGQHLGSSSDGGAGLG